MRFRPDLKEMDGLGGETVEIENIGAGNAEILLFDIQ